MARPGPLLAVCGLVGGAGTTTVAYLIARANAEERTEPVLVADTGGPSGGLAECAGVEAPRSLPELACDLAAGLPVRDMLYANASAGLRVLATGPDFATRSENEGLGTLLRDAREAHRLTVIDCGTAARLADRAVIAAATHVAWMLPATEYGITRGSRVLEAAPRPAAKELIVARRIVRQARAPLRDLRRIAAERGASLVLMPHVPGLDTGMGDRVAVEAEVAIQAILGVVKR